MKSKVKILVLCGLLMSFCATSNAQDYYGGGGSWRRQQQNNNQQPKDKDGSKSEPSGYISVNFGFATPQGAFGEEIGSGDNNGYGGYALPGSVFHFSLGIPIQHSNFGVALMFGSYGNEYDLNTYAYNNIDIPVFPDQNEYDESSIMGGLYVTLPIGGRLSIDGRLMGGALLCSLPEQDYGYDDAAGDQYQFDIQPSNSTSFAFDGGIGIRFMIAKFSGRKVCIMANADYLYSSASYNTEQIGYYTPYLNNPNNLTYQENIQISGHLPIQLFNVSFGIGYQL